MPPPNPRKPGNARPSLPSLVLARLTNADQRRSTPQPGNCQPTSPHTPLNPQTPPSVAKRLCTLSPLDSPLISPTDEDEDKYEWTHDQLATVIRVCRLPASLRNTQNIAHKSFPVAFADP